MGSIFAEYKFEEWLEKRNIDLHDLARNNIWDPRKYSALINDLAWKFKEETGATYVEAANAIEHSVRILAAEMVDKAKRDTDDIRAIPNNYSKKRRFLRIFKRF
ncbi:MAG: hypothetical protein IJT54_08830 [Candidatus Methanomethylophilaceae archaeon]|nr:hypothetical protein [Candidatus Methanomethylophilaceae archaeon]